MDASRSRSYSFTIKRNYNLPKNRMMNKFLKLQRKVFCSPIAIMAFFSVLIFSCTYQEDEKSFKEDEIGNKVMKDLSDIRVGYSSPSLNAPFYVVLEKEISKNVNEKRMSYHSVDGRGDISRQIIGIEDLMAQGIDILIVNPIDPVALVPTINAVMKSGIAVFIVDSFIDPKANYIASILADNQGNGALLGEWFVNQSKREIIRLAIISGAAGNPVGLEKRMGFVRGVAERQLSSYGSSNLHIMAQGWGNWTIGGGLEAAEDILVAHPNIHLILAENDAMAIGALKAIEAIGKQDKIDVLGFDGQKDALRLIEKGEMSATALNSPAELAALVVEAVGRYLNGEEGRGKIIHTKAVLIDKKNVNQFYDEGS